MSKTLPTAWTDHDRSLKPFLWKHRLVGLISSVAQLGLVGWLIVGNRGEMLELASRRFSEYHFVRWLYFFAAIGILFKAVGFPFSYWHHHLDKQKGLSKQKLGSWLGDQMKGILVGFLIGTIVLYVFYFAALSFHPYWWVGVWLFLIVFSILLAQLAPVILLPIFIKMKPMENGELKDRLLALAAKFQVKVKDVYHLGLGEKTEKGNAAFMGMGKTKRIVIGDTLYEKFPVAEVEAVFSHELGHQVHNDLWKGLLVSSVSMLITLYFADLLFHEVVEPWLGHGLSTPFGFFVFLVGWILVQMPLGVFQAAYSRSREWAADRFASEVTRMNLPLASALERLTFQNQTLFHPNPIWEFLTYSHPSPGRRIRKLKN